MPVGYICYAAIKVVTLYEFLQMYIWFSQVYTPLSSDASLTAFAYEARRALKHRHKHTCK